MFKKQDGKKDFMVSELAKLPEMVVATAYVYAVNMSKYGVDVANAWLTAVQQSEALTRAYEKGHYEALREVYASGKLGNWVLREELFDDEKEPRQVYGCDVCGFSLKSAHDKRDFCPNCGAYMRGKENE